MLKDQKRQTVDNLRSATPPSTPSSPSINPVSPLPTNKISPGCLPLSSPQYSSSDTQCTVNFMNAANPTFPMLNNMDSCKTNPSAAAALVMMNAILASQQNQVMKYFSGHRNQNNKLNKSIGKIFFFNAI